MNLLLSELRQFGLNPKQWAVYLQFRGPQLPYHVLLKNVEDPDIELSGSGILQQKRGHIVLHWLNLRLVC